MAEHCNCYCCDLALLDWHHYTKIINDQVMKLMTKGLNLRVKKNSTDNSVSVLIRNQLLSAMHSIVMGQVGCGFFELPLRHYRSESDLIFEIRKMLIICL
ncbi:hypothetical protein T05_667 [Trichinella murrelli]|uniref:Uncharacterized protein n=1 Tax=Trichinella murrelli TaxID=144512 RepID=A0A0V0TPE9_9BILA|nr:hypothetical protein T05_667 [Trichinella murrelli]